MKRSSLTEKMVLYFLALGIGSIVITGMFSYFTARKALLNRAYDQLTSIRITRTIQIESFFSDRLRETQAYTSSTGVNQFVHDLYSGIQTGKEYRKPVTNITVPDPDFYSGFAILDSTGNILYTGDPEPAFTCTLPVAHHLTDRGLQGFPYVLDYTTHDRSFVNPLIAFGAIQEAGRTLAYLAMIIRTEKIDEFILEVGPGRGLGVSGETYLVGHDRLMRSQSRFIPGAIMQTQVNTIPVKNALEGQSGTAQSMDYRGIEVLSSYGRVNIRGLNWVILAEIDYQEVTAAVLPIRNNILLLTVFTGIAFFIISFLISRSITRPLKKLKEAAIDLGEGKAVPMVKISADDEIGALADAFNRMAVNINEKDQALKTEKYNRLRSAIDGQDQERQRLSREMHDGIGQSMIAVRLQLGALENKVPEKIRHDFQPIIAMTDNLIDEVRAISNALMPPALAEFGLTAAIRNLCSNLTSIYGIETRFEGEIPEQLLGRKARLYLFRIFQEALTNVAKHSGATMLEMSSHLKGNLLIVRIADNGKGMEQPPSCNPKGHGLNNIRERASLLRGQATIVSAIDSGTSIQIELPVNNHIL